jgi:hypothetical protein
MTEAAQKLGKHLVSFCNHSTTVEYVKSLEETLEANVSLTEAKRGRHASSAIRSMQCFTSGLLLKSE